MHTLKLEWEAVRVCCVLDALAEPGLGLSSRERGLAEATLGWYRNAEHGATIKLTWPEPMIEHVIDALRRELENTEDKAEVLGLDVYREEIRAAAQDMRDYRAAVAAAKEV